jgi:hypothetical protein
MILLFKLWSIGYLVFGFVSFAFTLTTIKEKGFDKAGFPARLFYWHGIFFVCLFIIVSLTFIGVEFYEYVR